MEIEVDRRQLRSPQLEHALINSGEQNKAKAIGVADLEILQEGSNPFVRCLLVNKICKMSSAEKLYKIVQTVR